MELLRGREGQESPHVPVCVYTILSMASSLQSLRCPWDPPEGTWQMQADDKTGNHSMWVKFKAWTLCEGRGFLCSPLCPQPLPGTQQMLHEHEHTPSWVGDLGLGHLGTGAVPSLLTLPSPVPQGGDSRQQCGRAAAPGVHGNEVPGREELCAP